MNNVEYFVIRLLVDKAKYGKTFKAGSEVIVHLDTYHNKFRLRDWTCIMLEDDEYEMVIPESDFDQLLYCV